MTTPASVERQKVEALSRGLRAMARHPMELMSREWLEVRVELESAADALTSLLKESEELRAAGEKVSEGFDRGVFVRNTDGDTDPQWAIKLFPYLRALATLTPQSAVQEPR